MDSAIAPTYNLRPEQKLQNHTEYPKHEDQLPSARIHPEPYRLPGSLDSPQHFIRENDYAHQRRELVTVPTIPLADRDFFFRCAVISERKPDESHDYVQDVVAAQNGSTTRHYDQCASSLSLRTAKIRQSATRSNNHFYYGKTWCG